ncbi:MarR family winged helix-turn-helix transcriptional regulator [Streptomonospora litoralis]|uniref:HTH-type transcriptional regulator MhqR n=1 Tax=Streptomonospora litoralis TaxID=2498135 RepID=A0A4P6Q2S0_9ACTN|nr:MarR family winged helix-turn-helix transcriptional regulator [Streptomonospora litoralis]QBI54823.1 HTH-type transcriptional regulator MhqR [Streptomonospora litoralis]
MDAAPSEDDGEPAERPRSREDLYSAIRHDGQRLAAGLIRLLHAMSADSDLNPTDFQCYALLRVGGPMTPGEIAHGLRLTTGSVTVVVDRLARRGLVRRERHPRDRRKVVVYPQEAETVRTGTPTGLGAAMSAMHERYSEAELELIAAWLARAGTVLDEVATATGPAPDASSRRRREGGGADSD